MFLLTVCVLGFCFRILAVNLGLDFCQNPSTNGCKSEVTLVLGCAFIYKGGFQRQGQKLGVGERGVWGGGVSHSSKWSFHQYSKSFTFSSLY